MNTIITIKCQRCGREDETERTNELPEIVHHLEANYCPYCVTAGDDFWEEYWVNAEGKYVVQEIVNKIVEKNVALFNKLKKDV